MQNQINSGTNNQMNYQMNNQINNQINNQGNDPKSTKYYILGLVTGILSTLALVFAAVCAVNFFKVVNPVKIRGNTEKIAQAENPASITDAGVRKKLEILEDTIG